jgi:cbb3-type cytochrome oxidase cytochrome c subunit
MSEIFGNSLNILKKTADVFNDMNKETQKKTAEIITAKETDTLIQYLNTTHTEDKIQEEL